MGILTLQQDGAFVISSDRLITDAPVNRPPKGKPSASYQVWTGDHWSAVHSEAVTFRTMDAADEYVRANYQRLATG